MRDVRQPDFEPPEPEYVYKMDANPRMTGTDDQHFVQAYVKTAKQTLIPESVLFVGKADMCASLVERLNSGSLRQDDFITVSEARESCYTKDGAELNAIVGQDKKVYMGRRDHYDNHGHYLNDDNSLIHISDTYRVFELISGRETPYTYDQMFSTMLFSQEEALNFIRLQLNEPQTEKETEIPSSLNTTLDEYPLPDPLLFQADELEKNYGYMEGDLLPVGRERATNMLNQDFTVYAIVDGGSAEMVFDWTDMDERPLDTMYAISKEEWEASPEFQEAVADRMQHQENREQAFLYHDGDCFAIYQVKDDPALRDIRFESMDWLQSKGQTVERENYDLVYTAPLSDAASVDDALDQLWYQFNNEHPADYQHPSMSVSDIIAIKRDGVLSCHYCDSFGFQQLPDFIKPENYLKNAEVSTEDDLSMIDGIINNGAKATVAELEQQARNGQPISLMDLAAASHREQGEKKSVLAKLKDILPKQERKKSAPKKSAERER